MKNCIANIRLRLSAAALVSLLVPGAVFAEEPPVSAPQEASASPSPSPSPSPDAAPTAKPQQQEKVAPLGAWIYPDNYVFPQPGGGTPSPTPYDFSGDDAEDRRIFEKLLERYERKPSTIAVTTPLIKRSVLNKEQRKRIENAAKLQRQRIYRQRQFLAGLKPPPRRGLPEIRVCTLNLNNFGDREEMKKVLRKRVIKGYRKRERAIVNAINSAGCSAVALQGIVGTSYKRANDGLAALAERLEKISRWKWKGYLAPTNSRLVYNGFLISDYQLEVVTVRTHKDLPLARSGAFELEQFPRGPYEIELKVRTQGGGGSKRVQLLTYHFQSDVDPEKRLKESERMQLAEALRRLVSQRQNDRADSGALLLMLGDRAAGGETPAAEILAGRLELRNFFAYGSCNLKDVPKPEGEEAADSKESEEKDAKGKKKRKREKPKVVQEPQKVADCRADARGPKTLFGVTTENPLPAPRVYKREEDGEATYYRRKKEVKSRRKQLRALREQTAEIYMTPEDLKYARHDGDYAVYVTGAEKVAEGLPASPLLWVELNWW